MCCTFGDLTDVLWWRELRLPTRSVITRSGRLQREGKGVMDAATLLRGFPVAPGTVVG